MRESSAFYEAEINLKSKINKDMKGKKQYKSISVTNVEVKQIYIKNIRSQTQDNTS